MINFKIESIDPLGQGVFKENDNIYFIPKTLPGDEGFAKVWKKSKGVCFANLVSLTKESPLRKKTSCPHFQQCSGCHFLHTDYENELNFKSLSLTRIMQKITGQMPIIIKAPRRNHYRNRLQLHYDLEDNKIGLLDKKRIIEIKDCVLPQKELVHSFTQFVTKDWKSIAVKKNVSNKGHVELYLKENTHLEISWNQPYAQGGFSQVYQEMNQVLVEKLTSITNDLFTKPYNILDLFGGQGNLSQQMNASHSYIFDYYQQKPINGPNKSFYHYDLFKNPVKDLAAKIDCLIVDPPRSGFKNLQDWIQSYSPDLLAYVSCNPSTLARDLQTLPNSYKLKDFFLIDLFPGTYHFETLVTFSKID